MTIFTSFLKQTLLLPILKLTCGIVVPSNSLMDNSPVLCCCTPPYMQPMYLVMHNIMFFFQVDKNRNSVIPDLYEMSITGNKLNLIKYQEKEQLEFCYLKGPKENSHWVLNCKEMHLFSTGWLSIVFVYLITAGSNILKKRKKKHNPLKT